MLEALIKEAVELDSKLKANDEIKDIIVKCEVRAHRDFFEEVVNVSITLSKEDYLRLTDILSINPTDYILANDKSVDKSMVKNIFNSLNSK